METRKILSSNKKAITVTAAIILIAAAVLIFCRGNNIWRTDDRLKDFPAMKGEMYSVTQTETATALFYKDCTEDIVAEYMEKLLEAGIVFEQKDFPYSAEKGEIYLTIMYDQKTKVLSLTFSDTEKE